VYNQFWNKLYLTGAVVISFYNQEEAIHVVSVSGQDLKIFKAYVEGMVPLETRKIMGIFEKASQFWVMPVQPQLICMKSSQKL